MYNCVERLDRALNHKQVDRVPVTGMMTAVTFELMDKAGIYYPDAHNDPEKMVRLAAAAFEFAGLESLKIPFDMTVEAEALGCSIDYGNKSTLPQVKIHAFYDKDPEAIMVDRSFLDKGRVGMVLGAIKTARRRYDGIIPVVSSIVGPFTLATKLFGMERILEYVVLEPGMLKVILDKLTKICILYATEQANAGCNVVQIGEAACSGDLISPKTYGEFIAPCHNELCSAIAVPTVVHICGNITGHLDYIKDTKMTGISFDAHTDIKKAVSLLKGKVALVGYVDPLSTLLKGQPDDVYAQSMECMREGVDVLNAGCSWPPEISLENIKAMINAAKQISENV